MKDKKMAQKKRKIVSKKPKKATQPDRILMFLSMLSEGQSISFQEEGIDELLEVMESFQGIEFENSDSKHAYKYVDVGQRSLQKDMAYIKRYLGKNIHHREDGYKLVKQDNLDEFFQDNHEKIRKFFHAISLIDSSVFGENFKKYTPLLESIQAQQKEVYLFLENPFENLKQLALKKELEEYIQKRNYINIYYHSDRESIYRRVQAYKIIYANENWYLAVRTTEDYEVNSGFRLLRLNFIQKITKCTFPPLHFHEDREVQEFLNTKFQSLFSSFDKPYFRVTLEVSGSISRYFQVKKYLKSQEIVKTTENGVIVQFTINDDMELIPLIQRWIPHVKVLEPQSLKDRILKNIKAYQACLAD